MKVDRRLVATGRGWSVSEVDCACGPRDRPVEEVHPDVCIAAVTQGTFRYRSAQGSAVLTPGAMLLGNRGDAYDCAHEHAPGDRCLSFHFDPAYMDMIASEVPTVRTITFSSPRLVPVPSTLGLVARVDAACRLQDESALEVLGLGLAATVLAGLADVDPLERPPSARDERQITEAVRWIESRTSEPLTIADMGRQVGMSPYHFVRTFRRLVGVTPYQFLLRLRLHDAAVGLRRSERTITQVALDAGFNDLSTFNHRFRRFMGVSPRAFRATRDQGFDPRRGKRPGQAPAN